MSLSEVKESYSRCCVNPKFFDLFYTNFLASHPTIAPMFAKTDMAKQKSLLRQGVSIMFMHLAGNGVDVLRADQHADQVSSDDAEDRSDRGADESPKTCHPRAHFERNDEERNERAHKS